MDSYHSTICVWCVWTSILDVWTCICISGLVFWVFARVCWVSGFEFGMSIIVFCVSIFVFWVPVLVFWESLVVFWVSVLVFCGSQTVVPFRFQLRTRPSSYSSPSNPNWHTPVVTQSACVFGKRSTRDSPLVF